MAGSKDEKRELIMAKAREAFERFGLRKTTLEDIARGCGLRKASLYYYFASKEAVVAEMIRRVGTTICGRTRARVRGAGTVVEAFRAFFSTHDPEQSEEVLFLFRLAGEDLFGLLPLAEEALREMDEEHHGLLVGVLERGVREGVFRLSDPRRTASALFNIVRGIYMTIALEGAETMERKLAEMEEMIALVERGIMANVQGPARE